MIFSLNNAVTGMRVPAQISAALVTNGDVRVVVVPVFWFNFYDWGVVVFY